MEQRRKTLIGTVLVAAALVLAPFAAGAALGNAWVRVLDFANMRAQVWPARTGCLRRPLSRL